MQCKYYWYAKVLWMYSARCWIYNSIQQLHISRKKVHKICKREHIQIPKKGRPTKEVQQNQIDFVVNYREKFKVGCQRMAHISNVYNVPISKHQMSSIFKNNNLFLLEKKMNSKKSHKKAFVAKYTNQL